MQLKLGKKEAMAPTTNRGFYRKKTTKYF
jgi:hypothetical protein